MRIQRVSSKWAKTQAILHNSSLSSYIPDTRKYEIHTLKEMLILYETVYIKPDRGTYGSGVMRAEQRTVTLSPSVPEEGVEDNNERNDKETKLMYILRYGKSADVFSSPEELDAALMKVIQDRPYLIQKGINLLRHRDRPFDLRVLAQKNPEGLWETTGMLGRVAAPQKIVTNYHNGGRIRSVKALLKKHMDAAETALTINQLQTLGIRMGRQLETAYPGIKEIGLDVAIDDHHDLWLLEINTLPSIVVFKLFPDKSIYRKIHRYAAAYGRVRTANSPLQRKGKSKSSG
ncbi:YheC/YheD family protein [Paenibacillus sp. BR2-3]|uniref:YheC/YheD family protein n=1 Tax=Paenibacillus sp. BR2-3 TaxID=3048494 RepID=UPI0039775A4F